MSSGNGKTNGNGHASSAAVQATRALETAQRPLADLDKRIAAVQQQLLLVQAEQVVVEQEREQCEQNLVDDAPSAGANLRAVAGKEAELSAKLRALNKKLTAIQSERPALDKAAQDAAVALAQTMADEEFNALEEELSKARWYVAQAQEQLVQRQKICNELADRFRALSVQRRDAQWQQQRRVMAANFIKANPQAPGHERVRQGF